MEVVRGPGSALYGAGVDAGVVHFITKSPFSHPGTTVTISGGERFLLFWENSDMQAFPEMENWDIKLQGRTVKRMTGSWNPDDDADAAQICD